MSMSETVRAIRRSLSSDRLGTFEQATGNGGDEDHAALILYGWNAQVSASLLVPLHICEVVIRNAVSEAIETAYGPDWSWNKNFERSLPNPKTGFNSTRELQGVRTRFPKAGKMVAEMKFVFWQNMFTERFDRRIWDVCLFRVLPNLDSTKEPRQLCQALFGELDNVRKLRNRIAHHEPIFTRDLEEDFDRLSRIIELRCKLTADWMRNNQQATWLMQRRPSR